MNEMWLPVPGYEGFYEASNKGLIRSSRRRGTPGRILRPVIHDGYYQVCLNAGPGNRGSIAVHTLVLLAFAGPRPAGQQACHGPGGSLDNRWPENLYWGTPEQNCADKVRDHVTNRGARNGNAQLTWVEVCEIRRMFTENKMSQRAIGKLFGVGDQAISAIKRGKTWKHGPENW